MNKYKYLKKAIQFYAKTHIIESNYRYTIYLYKHYLCNRYFSDDLSWNGESIIDIDFSYRSILNKFSKGAEKNMK